MSIGQMYVGEMSVGEISIGEMSIGQMSIGEMSIGEIPYRVSMSCETAGPCKPSQAVVLGCPGDLPV